MNKNDYSKFKYQDSYQLKFAVNPYTQKTTTLGDEIRTIPPNLGNNFSGTDIHLNIGQTLVTDYVYPCTQVDFVDQPLIVDKHPIKQIFFKLYNFLR